MITIRFADAQSEEVSTEYGPYPFVQFTHEILRIGPDGDDLAYLIDGDWRICDDEQTWTDVIVSPS